MRKILFLILFFLSFVCSAKELRDSFEENYTNVKESENFIIRYGDEYEVEQETIDKLSEALEKAWNVEIVQYGFPPPFGCDEYKLNVYFGGSYDGAPAGVAGSGYADNDSEGYPMIVYSKERLEKQDLTIQSASHEFFHTVQMDTGSYGMDARPPYSIYWWMEGTAHWMANRVFPEMYDSTYLYHYIYYLFYPHFALNFSEGYPADMQMYNLHHYGAWIFALYLTDNVTGDDFIKKTWLDNEGESDPLTAIEGLLEDDGEDMSQIFADFAASTIYMEEFDHGDHMLEVLDNASEKYPEDDHRIAGFLSGKGTDWTEVEEKYTPQHHAFNIIKFENPDEGTLHIEFEGEPVGDYLTEAKYLLRLVAESENGEKEITSIPVEDHKASYALDTENINTVHLVVVTWDGIGKEIFPYKYKMLVEENEVPETDDEMSDEMTDNETDDSDEIKDEEESSDSGCSALLI